MDDESLEERLGAVERAVADGDVPDGLADSTALARQVGDVEDEVDDLEDRLADLEAAVQALRGYVGAVRGVNRDVERRADAALARVERLEDRDPREAGGDRARATAGRATDGPVSTPDERRSDHESDTRGATADRTGDEARPSADRAPRHDRRAASDGGERTPHPIPQPAPRDDRSLLERVRAWL